MDTHAKVKWRLGNSNPHFQGAIYGTGPLEALKNGKSQAPLHPKLIKTGWFHAWNKPYETQCSASVVNGRLELTNKSTKVLQLLAFPSLAVGYGHRVLCPCHFGLAHNHWPQIGLVQISWTISLYIYTVHIYIPCNVMASVWAVTIVLPIIYGFSTA